MKNLKDFITEARVKKETKVDSAVTKELTDLLLEIGNDYKPEKYGHKEYDAKHDIEYYVNKWLNLGKHFGKLKTTYVNKAINFKADYAWLVVRIGTDKKTNKLDTLRIDMNLVKDKGDEWYAGFTWYISCNGNKIEAKDPTFMNAVVSYLKYVDFSDYKKSFEDSERNGLQYHSETYELDIDATAEAFEAFFDKFGIRDASGFGYYR